MSRVLFCLALVLALGSVHAGTCCLRECGLPVCWRGSGGSAPGLACCPGNAWVRGSNLTGLPLVCLSRRVRGGKDIY